MTCSLWHTTIRSSTENVFTESFINSSSNNLYLKPQKCVFEQRRIKFLGVILQNGTIHMDPTKTQGVADWPRPTNITEVRSFLGFTGFYHYFIPNYSRIARPLLDLTKKTTVWALGRATKTRVWKLKNPQCANNQYWPTKLWATIRSTTWTHQHMVWAAILLQEGGTTETNTTQKPKLHPLAYYSASFIQAERNYNIYEESCWQ